MTILRWLRKLSWNRVRHPVELRKELTSAPAVGQCTQVFLGKFVAADAVVEKIDADAGGEFGQQMLLQFAADFIVVDDEELNQNVVLGGLDALEDGVERGGPVD